MNQEIEIEFKQLIDENTYDNMLDYFQHMRTPIAEQTNHYFDTAVFGLRSAGAALRVRNKNSRCILTLKEPHEKGLLETHQELTEEEFLQMKNSGTVPGGDVAHRIADLTGSPQPDVQYLGYLKTARSEAKLDDGLLVLDKSNYFDFTDYELEFECSDETEGKKAFERLLQDWQLERNAPRNKIERFYQAKTDRDDQSK
ncbi:CYTH domain-containing protein [Salisediminibacterium halotolerans]|uniref:Uncharacterized protein YjbK n=1 Tax=Salisediminibacterium halotolerans TaxID=517425 RepID=A0A1H9VEU7_9BACI|nr:CYTH domain-containing protein [Salisediminibacterium haloalkalitolerans]SES19747.1 Uncharacterized protein YjbK [Salisediminibacterium haloalkalitolerans]